MRRIRAVAKAEKERTAEFDNENALGFKGLCQSAEMSAYTDCPDLKIVSGGRPHGYWTKIKTTGK
jgi:hypothetical protein